MQKCSLPVLFPETGGGGQGRGERGAFRLASWSLCISLSLKGKGPRFTHSLLSPRPPLTTGRPWPVFRGLQLLGMGGPRSPSSLSLDSLSFPVGPPCVESSVTHSTRSQWCGDSHLLPVPGGCGMQRGHNQALLDECTTKEGGVEGRSHCPGPRDRPTTTLRNPSAKTCLPGTQNGMNDSSCWEPFPPSVHRPASRPGQDLPRPEAISAWEDRTEVNPFEAKSECSDQGGVRLGSTETKQVCTARSGGESIHPCVHVFIQIQLTEHLLWAGLSGHCLGLSFYCLGMGAFHGAGLARARGHVHPPQGTGH